jgi:hypothetical protein
MLNKLEIDSQQYKLLKYMICVDESPIFAYNPFIPFIVYDNNKRMLGITKSFMAAKALSNMNLRFVMGFQTKRSLPNDFTIKRTESWKLQLNVEKTEWKENLKIESIEQLNEYILINQKVLYLENIFQTIEDYRKIDVETDSTQQYIHISKYLESKDILDKNIKEDTILNYPYTTGYAKFKNITLQESAKIIKFQHESRAGLLAETENLRMKYKKMIVEENNIKNLPAHLDSFKNEIDKYSDI